MMYDIKKQPVWVQDEITGLERQIGTLEGKLEEARKNKELIGYAGHLNWDRPVGVELDLDDIETHEQGTAVHFKTGGHTYISVRQTRGDQSVIEVYSSDRPLLIEPRASNVVSIKQRERD